MTVPDAFAFKRSGLGDILTGAIGTEVNGMTLTLLSAFARAGADPWQEAGRLAALPRREAIDSLARTIAGLPATLWPLPMATDIATRLVALLPTRASVSLALPVKGKPVTAYARPAVMLIGVALLAAYLLGLLPL
ncbi:hypothetical protein D3874_11625 [Oleomonas cavernae]|uniref:Uncharacterized protein n=1 Tax=Oleomonas cavernae TaxID=2320859 RepID=A0A418WC34_9PROT|nr:hypothetical protein [Oleomonas cavernae]RJF87591.1 hypothetical protein D3874_11625 [Oleomonas cavernae]